MGPMQWPVAEIAELGGRIGLGLLSPFTCRIFAWRSSKQHN